MIAPLYSTVTLVAEIFVSSAIFYSFYQGYKNNRFPKKVAIAALTYEILFNISYMAYKLPSHEDVPKETWRTILGAFHGILSLIMFISLIVFFVTAIKHYDKGVNYFKERKWLTVVFLSFWTVSILTGITFYFVEYYT